MGLLRIQAVCYPANMKRPTLLLSLLVWTACTPVSSQEMALREARGRLYMQELNQGTRQLRNICQELLDLNREALARTKTSIAIRQQILTYQAEALNLLKQKPTTAGARAQEISGAFESFTTRILENARWFTTSTQRVAELQAQLKAHQHPDLPGDLPGWTPSEWAVQQGRRTIAEAEVLCEQAEQVRRARQPFSQRLNGLNEQIQQNPLDSLIDRLEQIAI